MLHVYYIILYCTVFYCTVFYCIVLTLLDKFMIFKHFHTGGHFKLWHRLGGPVTEMQPGVVEFPETYSPLDAAQEDAMRKQIPQEITINNAVDVFISAVDQAHTILNNH